MGNFNERYFKEWYQEHGSDHPSEGIGNAASSSLEISDSDIRSNRKSRSQTSLSFTIPQEVLDYMNAPRHQFPSSARLRKRNNVGASKTNVNKRSKLAKGVIFDA